MGPKLPQDGSKMASWRVLGSFGGQVGPKMEPRGFQARKTQFVPPHMLGPKLVPHFWHFNHQGGSQEAWRPSWITCCVQTPLFRREGVSRDPPRSIENVTLATTPCTFCTCQLFACWMALGCQLGPILGAFWVPSWAMLGTKLAYNGSSTSCQKLYGKKSCTK